MKGKFVIVGSSKFPVSSFSKFKMGDVLKIPGSKFQGYFLIGKHDYVDSPQKVKNMFMPVNPSLKAEEEVPGYFYDVWVFKNLKDIKNGHDPEMGELDAKSLIFGKEPEGHLMRGNKVMTVSPSVVKEELY